MEASSPPSSWWFTDAEIAAALPNGSPSAADLQQLVGDATVVYQYLGAHAGTSDAALRTWGQGRGIGPDRMNAALALLQEGGKCFLLPVSAPLSLARATPPESRVLSEGFSAADLRKAAVKLSVDVPKSASKPEIVSALLSET